MKRILIIIVLCALLFAGCAVEPDTSNNEAVPAVAQPVENTIPDDMFSTINDWILGTEYGIEAIDFDSNTFTITMPEDKKAQLADYELSDISESLTNIGTAFNFKNCEIAFADGAKISSGDSAAGANANSDIEETVKNIPADGETVNLIFIHHSVGENWLNDGLNGALNNHNIHVADTYYGWSDMGDHTDTVDWPRWFNDQVMPSVYSKLDTETAFNTIAPGSGENTIVMFKSCFPNSKVGKSIDDEIAIYDSLLPYFAQHPDKMFVLITSPPMQRISHAEKTRELTNYLVSKDGWLKDYQKSNVFVFDLYNVLTSPDNHHMLIDGLENHIIDSASNTLYYDSGGDDHPNTEGNIKATEEFVPLLMYWYDLFKH